MLGSPLSASLQAAPFLIWLHWAGCDLGCARQGVGDVGWAWLLLGSEEAGVGGGAGNAVSV